MPGLVERGANRAPARISMQRSIRGSTAWLPFLLPKGVMCRYLLLRPLPTDLAMRTWRREGKGGGSVEVAKERTRS